MCNVGQLEIAEVDQLWTGQECNQVNLKRRKQHRTRTPVQQFGGYPWPLMRMAILEAEHEV